MGSSITVQVRPRSRVKANCVIVARGVCVNSSSVCSHFPLFVFMMHIAATAIWLGLTGLTAICDSPQPLVGVPTRRYCSATTCLSGMASVSCARAKCAEHGRTAAVMTRKTTFFTRFSWNRLGPRQLDYSTDIAHPFMTHQQTVSIDLQSAL